MNFLKNENDSYNLCVNPFNPMFKSPTPCISPAPPLYGCKYLGSHAQNHTQAVIKLITGAYRSQRIYTMMPWTNFMPTERRYGNQELSALVSSVTKIILSCSSMYYMHVLYVQFVDKPLDTVAVSSLAAPSVIL